VRYLLNTTVLVYLSEAKPDLPGRVDCHTISEVASELSFIVGESEASAVLEGVSIVDAVKTKSKGEERWLSTADIQLAAAAKSSGFVLVSDDKKLLSAAKQNKTKCLDTPHFIESLTGKIEKSEALEILARLKPVYLRKKLLESVEKRIRSW